MKGEPTGVPTKGPINRILSSRFSNGQGVQYVDAGCGDADGCPGQYLGQLQPYSIYVPNQQAPPRGRGLTLLLHSLGGSFNQMHGTKNQSQFGERGKGHIVITPESRGPDGWYYGLAGAEVFEVWADVARRYRLDPAKTAVTGYSMGGYGTYKFGDAVPRPLRLGPADGRAALARRLGRGRRRAPTRTRCSRRSATCRS